MKYYLGLFLLIIVLLSGCSSQVDQQVSNESSNEDFEVSDDEYQRFLMYQANTSCNYFEAVENDDIDALTQSMIYAEEIALKNNLSSQRTSELNYHFEENLTFQEDLILKIDELCPEVFSNSFE